MFFNETRLNGSFIIRVQKLTDDRGFFCRAWCKEEFTETGLKVNFVQHNIGFSNKKRTLRGLHYQLAPHQEVKLVRCTRGAVYNVIVDLRPNSPTYKEWLGIELSADNHTMIYVPEGFANGYQTLTDNAEICYQTTAFFSPECARGLRYNDPTFNIEWPLEVESISEQDRRWPDYLL
jgi:dTDP-4-dehydrorhamnose 3,5-epimerase